MRPRSPYLVFRILRKAKQIFSQMSWTLLLFPATAQVVIVSHELLTFGQMITSIENLTSITLRPRRILLGSTTSQQQVRLYVPINRCSNPTPRTRSVIQCEPIQLQRILV